MRYRTRVWYYEEDGSRHQGKGHIPADRPVDVEFNDIIVKLEPHRGGLELTIVPNRMRYQGLLMVGGVPTEGAVLGVGLAERPEGISILGFGHKDREGDGTGASDSRGEQSSGAEHGEGADGSGV